MDLSFYNIIRNPFGYPLDAGSIWLGGPYEAVLECLMGHLRAGSAVIGLTGCSGIGKSTVARQLTAGLSQTYTCISIDSQIENKIDCYNRIATQLGCNRTLRSRGSFLVCFRQLIENPDGGGRRILLAVDNFDRADTVVLEELNFISKLTFNRKQVVTLLLVGEDPMFSSNEDMEFGIRAATVCRIERQSLRETEDYIRHMLAGAGTKKRIFDSEAVEKIWQTSKGIPRDIVQICDRALRIGALEQMPLIGSDVIERCKDKPPPETMGGDTARSLPVLDVDHRENIRKSKYSYFRNMVFVFSAAAMLIFAFGYNTPSNSRLFDSALKKCEQIANRLGGILNDDAVELSPRPVNPLKRLVDVSPKPPAHPVSADDDRFDERSFVIHFTGEAGGISNGAVAELNRAADSIGDLSNAKILIAAIIDSGGNYWHKRKLSNLRANMVKSFFIGKGVSPSNIEIVFSDSAETAVDRAVKTEASGDRMKITMQSNILS